MTDRGHIAGTPRDKAPEVCLHCEHDLDHIDARKGNPARWYCEWCGRAGDYARGYLDDGRVFTARIETTGGAPRKGKPWVPLDSLPYAERTERP